MQIRLPPDFSTEWMLNHIRTSSYGVPYRFTGGRMLARALWLPGGPAVLEFDLSRSGTLAVRRVSADRRLPGLSRTSAAYRREVESLVRFLWGLTADAGPHQRAIAADPDLSPLSRRFGGLTILRAPDLYEALVVAVIGQQVSVAAAQSVRQRLMDELGMGIRAGRGPRAADYRLYPAPLRLLTAGGSALRRQGLSRQKSAYLLAIAERAAAGALDRAAFAGLSDEQALARLCEIKGVGRWTAEIALMRGLGRADVFPAGDLGLRVALQETLGLRERPTEERAREIAERWRGWRSVAAFYLWMTLQSRAL